jgi:hypothetical protein
MLVDDMAEELNTTSHTLPSTTREDAEWIDLRPSNISLALTSVAALLAAGVVLWMELEDLTRLILLAALLIAAVVDLYFVRLKGKDAIAAFRLMVFEDARTKSLPVNADVESSKPPLRIQLRYRYPSRRGGVAEAEATVEPRCYVSVYFTSIVYHFSNDPAWRKWYPRVLPIWPDSIGRDAFRRLRVQLKWR